MDALGIYRCVSLNGHIQVGLFVCAVFASENQIYYVLTFFSLRAEFLVSLNHLSTEEVEMQ